jgi:hypothetical protein
MPDNNQMLTGLTSTPWADTARPAAKTLRAALMSRSWMLPHSGHTHSRTFNGILGTVCPQSEHRLLDGYHHNGSTAFPSEIDEMEEEAMKQVFAVLVIPSGKNK